MTFNKLFKLSFPFLLFCMFFSSNIYAAQGDSSGSKGETILEKLFDTDFAYFLENFRINGKLVLCKPDDITDGLFGLQTHTAWPMYIYDTTKERFFISALQLKLGSRTQNLLTRNGQPTEDNMALNSHLMKFNLMGMILKEAFEGIFCLGDGELSFSSFSEVMPNEDDLLDCLMNETCLFANVLAFGTCPAHAIAANLYEYMDKYKDPKGSIASTLDSLSTICNGSNGFASVGARTKTDDYSSNAMNVTTWSLRNEAKLQQIDQALSVINNEKENDILCNFTPGPMVYHSYAVQQLYPVVNDTHHIGATPLVKGLLANDLSTGSDTYGWVWVHSDYAALARACK